MNLTLEQLSHATGIDFIPCSSSNIFAYGYTEEEDGTRYIYICYHKSDHIYEYPATREEFIELYLSPSKGKWVNEYLVKSQRQFDKYEMV